MRNPGKAKDVQHALKKGQGTQRQHGMQKETTALAPAGKHPRHAHRPARACAVDAYAPLPLAPPALHASVPPRKRSRLGRPLSLPGLRSTIGAGAHQPAGAYGPDVSGEALSADASVGERSATAAGRALVMSTGSSSASRGDGAGEPSGAVHAGAVDRTGDEAQSNDWEVVVDMYTTGRGTDDGVALRLITKGDGRRVADRKLLEKRRTIGKTF